MNWTAFFLALAVCAVVVGTFCLLAGLGLVAAWVGRKYGEGAGVLFIVVALPLLLAAVYGLAVGAA